ncbi:D-cysteine desulfhydrase family protein [Ruegeria sp. Ofav3-42]|uniref:D-cysteine desulfhydrase family protein n=1 Tax=Ruegeria sp. Ofav3-42 TaxID=2917759 RepID=UPI001EF46260|nr:D-cysteine desulfhydrase family protein [Ruegeria sp. Ofav3-42]MCG7521402.1 D-cysteine desulfhydrase family protein [Ruegeria sp. Ofav3-42]
MARTNTLANFPRARLMSGPTPLERLDRMSNKLGIDLWLKRDDLTGLGFGGNKTRQLEFYFGDALQQGADTILITGAVQSNYVRSAAAAAARLGMQSVLQLEERVPDMGADYYSSGNVLLAKILGAEHMSYPKGEDEAGADAALHARAEELKAQGRKPYVIHLGLNHPPLGALGYVVAGQELCQQMPDFDAVVVPSGSGATHGGLLTGVALAGVNSPVFGVCVRRDSSKQHARMQTVLQKLADLLEIDAPALQAKIEVLDEALPPGYGKLSATTRNALEMMARTEGVFLDPVYSAKTFAGLLHLVDVGKIQPGQKVVMLHTGGLPALFGYQSELTTSS